MQYSYWVRVMDIKPVFVYPSFEELEEKFMQCPTFRERHCWVSDERRRALITEFAGKLTGTDWINFPQIVGKICYLSNVPAEPIKESKTPWNKWYRYEVHIRLDVLSDVAYVVMEIQHTFRNKVFGVGMREIWVTVDVFSQAAAQLNTETASVFKDPSMVRAVKSAAFAQPSGGLKFDSVKFWFSDQPFDPVEMWEDGDEERP